MAGVLIFGLGFIGAAFAGRCRGLGLSVAATARQADKREALRAQGMTAIDPQDKAALNAAAQAADLILITSAPQDDGCPAFAALSDLLEAASRKWIGYLSTTGVYGDRGGGWVFEESALLPLSAEGRRRVRAESQWQSLSDRHDVAIFRLPGLYGPGRSIIERLRDGTARRIHKPGQVFSRLYDADCADALLRSAERPRAGAVYNLCDDEPAPADEVLMWAARTFGFAAPPEIAFDAPDLSAAARRFYAENKRVSNARAKAELGWRPAHPTYREGLNEVGRKLNLIGQR